MKQRQGLEKILDFWTANDIPINALVGKEKDFTKMINFFDPRFDCPNRKQLDKLIQERYFAVKRKVWFILIWMEGFTS